MSKLDKSYVHIRIESIDKRVINKIKKIIQEELLWDDTYSLVSKLEYSPKKGTPGKHWVNLALAKTYKRAIAKSDGGDYGDN